MPKSTRCRLWRHHPTASGDRNALPGRDRNTWTPCRARVEPGRLGCDDCYRALLVCPIVAVRKALASDSNTPPEFLHALATDGEVSVALSAEGTLRRLQQDEAAADEEAKSLEQIEADLFGESPLSDDTFPKPSPQPQVVEIELDVNYSMDPLPEQPTALGPATPYAAAEAANEAEHSAREVVFVPPRRDETPHTTAKPDPRTTDPLLPLPVPASSESAT